MSESRVPAPDRAAAAFEMPLATAPGVDIFTPRGDLDVTSAREFRRAVSEPAHCQGAVVVIDLTELGFLDSIGIGSLVSAWRHTRDRGAEMVVVCPRGRILNLLITLRLTTLLQVHHSIDVALRALRSDGPCDPSPGMGDGIVL